MCMFSVSGGEGVSTDVLMVSQNTVFEVGLGFVWWLFQI